MVVPIAMAICFLTIMLVTVYDIIAEKREKRITLHFDEHYYEVGDIIVSDRGGQLYKVVKVKGNSVEVKKYKP